MRLVQDLVFLESLEFYVDGVEAAQAKAGTFSIGEAAVKVCELVGLELVDYDTVMWHPVRDRIRVELHSRAWRERWQRTAQMVR
jgi:hypothetical protein